MQTETLAIINDPKKEWESVNLDNIQIYYKGYCWINDRYQSFEKIQSILSRKKLEGDSHDAILNLLVQKITGHFSLIINTPDFCIAYTDKIQSHPLFYGITENTFCLSNSANIIADKIESPVINKKQKLAFKMAGYTIGRNTLIDSIYQIQPGEILIVNKKEYKIERKRYYTFWETNNIEQNEQQYFNDTDRILEKTFSKLIESLNGAPVFIPLSGGYDSRIVLALLKEYGYDNITTFTYGIKGLWEIDRAKEIADYMGVDWHYLEFKTSETKGFYHTEDRKKYFKFAGELNTVPSIPEYFSTLLLKQKNILEPDAVIINGQTGDFLTGGHIPKILNTEAEVSADQLFLALIHKHFSLWINMKSDKNIAVIEEMIAKELPLNLDPGQLNKNVFAKLFEYFEWEHRQSKHVVNGQRAYDWFSVNWRLPLWSDELMEYWIQIPWEHKIHQNLFKKYLKDRDFGNLFNLDLPPEYPFQPAPVWAFRKFFGLLQLLTGLDTRPVTNKYTRYFMNYAPMYPQRTYREYLKDSKWHRNPVSYWVNDYLDEVNV